jgi:hypothetical protein
MTEFHQSAAARALTYLGVEPLNPLGSGMDGIVYSTAQGTAIKIFDREASFQTELKVYRRLRRFGVEVICGLNVPQLVNWHLELQIIEMSLVRPPYILDFAKATVGKRIRFDRMVVREWHRRVRSDFGSRWRDAMNVYDYMARHFHIYLLDLNPRNLRFHD